MPLDTNLLAVRPGQFSLPSTSANELLARANLEQRQQEIQNQNALRKETQGLDLNTQEGQNAYVNSLRKYGYQAEAQDFVNKLTTQKNVEAQTRASQMDVFTKNKDTIGKMFLDASNNPTDENLIAHANDAVNLGLDKDMVNGMLQDIFALPPEQRGSAIRNFGMSALQQTEGIRAAEKAKTEAEAPTTKERTDGQYKWEVYSNPNLPNYGQEVPNSRIKQQLTPDQAADLALRRQTEERLAKEAEAKTNAPATTSREAALSFLKEAGYDATTDTDDVSSMIPESTSGWLEKKGSEIYGGVTGESTEGQKILGKLESRASKLVINLLGGKLGAGISNPDRDFMTKAVGDIGNADLPADKRLSAWKDLMLRMKAAAGVVPANIAPTVPGGGGAGAGVQPSATNERQTKSGVKYTVRENP
jgi:hypothetical protein